MASHPLQYDVALSFAGEQRKYVGEVAEHLREAGASVFYDLFEDLWGADLPVRLGEVYRRQSRYVVIFVSKEYVAKSWPNHERQHALAGRIERMDQSVLPARFDPIDLPGLPTTVGYLDIQNLPATELANRILQKLGMAQKEAAPADVPTHQALTAERYLVRAGHSLRPHNIQNTAFNYLMLILERSPHLREAGVHAISLHRTGDAVIARGVSATGLPLEVEITRSDWWTLGTEGIENEVASKIITDFLARAA